MNRKLLFELSTQLVEELLRNRLEEGTSGQIPANVHITEWFADQAALKRVAAILRKEAPKSENKKPASAVPKNSF